jgi:hypothetical protein
VVSACSKLINAKANAWSSSFRLTCKYKKFHSI